jgi:hypothetical protein
VANTTPGVPAGIVHVDMKFHADSNTSYVLIANSNRWYGWHLLGRGVDLSVATSTIIHALPNKEKMDDIFGTTARATF